MTPNHRGYGYAHGKVILIGEHAVVYGCPAIVLPMPAAKIDVTVSPSDNESLILNSDLYEGPLTDAPSGLYGVAKSVTTALEQIHGRLEGLRIDVTSNLPPGRGLGSSAAVVAAMIQGLADYYNFRLTHTRLMELIGVSESWIHGTPSGIDAQAVVSDVPFWFVKESAPAPMHTSSPIHFLVADSGQPHASRVAVESVRRRYDRDPHGVLQRLRSLASLAETARVCLQYADVHSLGQVLNAAQAELAFLELSSPMLNHLIDAARKAGALGAKLTGSGHGGCILVLARHAKQAKTMVRSLKDAGAAAVWELTL